MLLVPQIKGLSFIFTILIGVTMVVSNISKLFLKSDLLILYNFKKKIGEKALKNFTCLFQYLLYNIFLPHFMVMFKLLWTFFSCIFNYFAAVLVYSNFFHNDYLIILYLFCLYIFEKYFCSFFSPKLHRSAAHVCSYPFIFFIYFLYFFNNVFYFI